MPHGFGTRFGRDASRYDNPTIALHWLTACLVAALWAIGQLADFAPRGAARHVVWSTHVTLGLTLIAVFVVRVLWRSTRGRGLPPSDPPALEFLAKLTHWGLYALLALVLAFGIGNVAVRGWDLWGLHIPALAANDRALRRLVFQIHSWAANTVLIVAGLHAAAALFHHYIWRDGVLRRMLPAARQGG